MKPPFDRLRDVGVVAQDQVDLAAVGQFGDMGVELVQGDAAGALLVLTEAAIGEYDCATPGII